VFGRGWRVGRIGGIDIRVDGSWAIIAALLTFNLWAFFSEPGRFPEIGSGGAFVFAVLTAASLFGCLLGHELAHAGMCRARGIEVSGITLFIFGGATHAKIESRGPADEFLVTVVGPLTSAALGGLAWVTLRLVHDATSGPARFMLAELAVLNLTLAVFNLLPGFPLDGGRLVRAGLWGLTKDLGKATRIAARIGQGMAILLVPAGFYLAARWDQSAIGFIWPAFIALFLFQSASATLARADQRKVLERSTAREVMSPPPPTIPGDTTLGTAMQQYLSGHEGEAFPVTDGLGRVVGFVSLRTARGRSPEEPVDQAMVPMDGVVTAGADETMDVVVDRLGDQPGRTVLVLDQVGALLGVIEPRALQRYLSRSR
jgi:Zn-dependent protease